MSAPSNQCGTCTQCCKQMTIHRDDGTVLSEYGAWCPLVDIGHGCREYEGRPAACRAFACAWLQSQDKPGGAWPVEFRPDKTRVVTVAGEKAVVLHVDPHRPDAYRTGLFGAFIARLAQHVPVVARIGERRVAIGSKAAAIVEERTEKNA